MIGTIVKPCVSVFHEYTKSLRTLAESLQGEERERVSEETAILAAYCVKNIALESEYDIVLSLTAFNVCNTYVKQRDHNPAFSYRFKQHLNSLLSAVVCREIQSVMFDFQIDKGMNVLVVQAGSIQFSFHQVSFDHSTIQALNEQGYVAELPWDQIYKQNCAQSLFYAALACGYNTNETFRGKNLVNRMHRQITNYHNGQLNVEKVFSFS